MSTDAMADPLPRARAIVLGAAALLWAATAALALAGAWWWALACGLPALLLSLGLLAWLLLARALVAVAVSGGSMEPTYHHGDWVLVRRSLPPTPGQVVVVAQPTLGPSWQDPPPRAARRGAGAPAGRWLVKRVAAVAGDPVPRDRFPALAEAPEHRVPAGKIVLLGDNQDVSMDSRRLGYFPADRVLGTVVRRLALGPGRAPRPR